MKKAKPEFRVGQEVIDLNNNRRRIVKVVLSVAYELDVEPNLLYQPDEIRPLTKRKQGAKP